MGPATENGMKKEGFLVSEAQSNGFPGLAPEWRCMKAPILNCLLG